MAFAPSVTLLSPQSWLRLTQSLIWDECCSFRERLAARSDTFTLVELCWLGAVAQPVPLGQALPLPEQLLSAKQTGYARV
ncbi:hypothetical protein XM38_022840 [Halomicronema hongdechloris C2206]|uniref:Uncharacterized protein n=1 Tax=Halomicronema hongdechloris C2206 TaxID=1641165 RepID=A0A1Z3HLY6_9CYAN|nr:hypothetical protein XM38_022840 [Halomicronema hongdechloris C2206]